MNWSRFNHIFLNGGGGRGRQWGGGGREGGGGNGGREVGIFGLVHG
jgi:hypothetical protein